MTLAEIRTLAECSRGAGNPIVDTLADFAIAVLNALDALGNDRGPLGTSHVGPMLAEGIRVSIMEKLK